MKIRTEWCDSSTSSFTDLFYTKEETISSVIDNFNYRRNYSAEGFSVVVDKTTTEQVIIQDHSNPINESRTDKKMLIPMDSVVKTGSYVEFRNDIWLVVSNVNIVDDAYKSCQIQRCNYTIQFQNKSGTILSYPSVFKKTSGIGVSESKVINTDEKKYTVLLPLDVETKLLKEDKRFLCDVELTEPTAYILTRRDALSHNVNGMGILEIDITACARKDNVFDRIDLMIADYFSPTIPLQDESGILSYSKLKCSSASNQISVGSYRYITATMYDSKDVINTTINPVFTYTYPAGFEDQFTVSVIDRNKIKLSVKDNNALLSKSVKVGVSDGQGGFVSELTLTIIAGA